ncbi:hypothetical protein OIU79_005496 [Salix purpurea]|uniref:Uncharacterized protein n=1 Tax=Salix purpurea TaxID=77065 RepID=A0A9Q0SAH0_SALPP|nr:hypothetical protein OIU79_005496 [Salix purpurea]
MSKQVQFFFEATLFGSPQGKPTRRTSTRFILVCISWDGNKVAILEGSTIEKSSSSYLIFRFLLLCDVLDGVLIQDNSFYFLPL